MQIFLNDSPVTCAENSFLSEILTANGIPMQNIAVAIDNTVIPKTQWATTPINDGCRIMIIKAVQGG